MPLDADDKQYISQQLGSLEQRMSERQDRLEVRLETLMRQSWRDLVGVLQEDFNDTFKLLTERFQDFTLRRDFDAHVSDRTLHPPPAPPVLPARPRAARRTARRR